MRERNPELHRERVSKSLIGNKRRYKGEAAGYVAKHMWIYKMYGMASRCVLCNTLTASRYEWANVSGKYLRCREDYIELCPSCHRRLDYGDKCKRGHQFNIENTYITPKGWRQCRICQRDRERRSKNVQGN